MIKLDKMEFPYNFNKYLLKYFLRYLKNININRYPNVVDIKIIKKKILKFYKTKKKIIIGNGSDDLISFIIKNFKYKNFKFISSFYPSFSMYEKYCNYYNVPYLRINLYKNKYFNLFKILKILKIYKCGIFFICYPNNPTGFFFNKKKISYIIKNNKNILFVVDEAYFNYSKSTFIKKKYRNIIILRTFSKIGFAALRIGLMFCNKNIYNRFYYKLQPYNLNFFQILFLKFILKYNVIKKINLLTKKIIKQRKKIYLIIKKIVYKSNCNFFFIKIKNYNVFKILYKKNLFLRQLFFFKKKFLRFSILKKSSNEYFLSNIKNERNF
ncbi:aminotransferase class I/II-fold pyridoxal phosphate-dependent enzyme [Candidatus Vidania fulgoroideorum]